MAVTERTFLAAPIADAGNRVIASPFQFAVDGTDNLRVSAASSLAGVVIGIDYRFLGEDNTIRAASLEFRPTATRMMTSAGFALGKGYVLNLTCFAKSGNPRIGQVFVKIDIIRGLSAATIALGTMLQGYITAKQGLGWPGSPIENSLAAEPVDRTLAGTVPAAGAQFKETVPAGARWDVISIFARLVTSGTPANRFVNLGWVRDNKTHGSFLQPTPQVASRTFFYTWGQNLPMLMDATNFRAQQPISYPALLRAGDWFESQVENLQADDQWGPINYTVREWLEVDE